MAAGKTAILLYGGPDRKQAVVCLAVQQPAVDDVNRMRGRLSPLRAAGSGPKCAIA
ncbi:MAG TPA: hypothetical protein VN085_11285 [Vicinamibacterales bacterium]|nr:hypothetical protein [Vicinamibacterales bacterium]